jgi:hypothetical protein
MMPSIVTKTFLLSWIFYRSLVAVAQDDLTVKAHVDNTIIGLNQQFTLHVELSGKGVNSASNPELPNMDDFASYLGSGSSQNFQYINGRMSVSKTISYHFHATSVGKFQIGPVIITAGGKRYQTDPIAIEIQKTPSQSKPTQRRDTPSQGTGPAEGDLFLRATVNKKQVYQNEPVIVTYKIYTRVNVTSFGYTKLPGTAGFWVEEFPQARQPETHSEILEGKRYTIATIRKMALFPMSPGTKTIDPLEIECEVRVQRRSRDIFDDFFSDPFGRTVSKPVKSKPVNVKVLPLPEEGKPPDFSGIVGQFKIIGTVDKSGVKTNEAVSFKVKIEGKGNIRTLPEPKVVFPSDFESYPPKVTENIDRKGLAVSGSKTYEYVLVPRIPGIQKIKPVRLSTFNPETKKYTTLLTDEIIIDVAKGKDVLTVAPTGLSKEEVKLLGQDIRFIKTEIPSFQKIGVAFYKKILFWVTGIFPLLCLGGALGYRRHLNRMHGDVAYARDRRASRTARKHLSTAKSLLKLSTQKDFYSEVGKALMGYLGNKLNMAEAGMITEDAQRMLRDRGVKEETIKSYFDCLNTCDLKRFSPTGTNEIEMREFFKQAEREIVRLDRAISK